MSEPIDIIFQDEQLVVVHKPAGALVHRSALDRHAPVVMLQRLRDQLGRHVHPAHRLDRPTSGLLMFAFDRHTAARLGEAFREQRVAKRYLAVVRGIGPEHALLDWSLREEDGRRPKAEQPAMTAATRVRRLDSIELPVQVDRYPQSRYSLMEAVPLTGRRHQIRRHLSRSGHPIIGDAKHGKGVHNRFFRDRLNSDRLLLAAVELGLEHPIDGYWLSLQAPVADDFAALLSRLGWAGHNPPARIKRLEQRPVDEPTSIPPPNTEPS
ncbi:pseudouridine synthase [Kushneria phosphatilytica]|uniref:tRNA pseudouridine synthase C n=1 Tax=Kushneria phosphatilytica TaxID=657387 RepID=A0A1S1NRP1_9GAMM|nr:pseudouridine synthase [Kushneria phosphatilytica]OHV07762.1 pseudouridylate synthase [Kushneria phosphatilytica]QEL10265.1 pseudouridylate synthase [Kushneria phosphatilytica]